MILKLAQAQNSKQQVNANNRKRGAVGQKEKISEQCEERDSRRSRVC